MCVLACVCLHVFQPQANVLPEHPTGYVPAVLLPEVVGLSIWQPCSLFDVQTVVVIGSLTELYPRNIGFQLPGGGAVGKTLFEKENFFSVDFHEYFGKDSPRWPVIEGVWEANAPIF